MIYCELWNEDTQFYRTVYVISWTVALLLSSIMDMEI